jgi:predicted ATPase/DNA-binding SARP family transcriptional activator
MDKCPRTMRSMHGDPPLHLLGRPWLARADGTRLPLGPERRAQVLAVLGLTQAWIGRDRLAAMFWPDRAPGVARANLRKVLLDMRRLGVAGVEESPAGLRWCVASDVQLFEEACRQGSVATAIELGQPTLLEGLEGHDCGGDFIAWLTNERQALRERWRTLVRRALHDAQGAPTAAPDAALALAERLLQVDAADEEALAAALRAAHALRRPDLAQSLWQRHVLQHAGTADAEPSPTLLALAQGPHVQAALTPLAPLVGRQAELVELARRLMQGRLVSVLGPGGVGKTRLARHVSDTLAPQFADGVFFVPLADLSTPAALAAGVAAALGLVLDPRADAGAALMRHLASRAVLLVLDGFEPLVDAASQLPCWLAAAPGLRVLVTTRERLETDGEWVLPLAGLEPPSPDAQGAALLDNDAVRLFALRALAVNPQFDLNAAAAPVAAICRRVGGLPLALEMAAAWVRMMPAADIARELGASLALLQDEPGGLRVVFDRSWQLLTLRERQACARLAVFRGGFTRDAAGQVTEVPVPLLAALLDKSMLQSRPDGRLGMHPLLHEHARERLGPHTELATRHARWALDLARRGALPAADRANLLAAFDHAVDSRDSALLEGSLHPVRWYECLGDLAVAAARFEGAAARFEAGPHPHTITAATLRVQEAWMRLWLGHSARAEGLAQGALAVLESTDRAGDCVAALRTLGHAARRQGRYREAASCFERGIELAHRSGLTGAEAALRDALAMALNMLGEHEAARAQLQRARPLNKALGDDVQQLYNHYNCAQSHSLAGDPTAALPWARAAVAAVQRTGFAFFEAYARTELALVLLALGQIEWAETEGRLALDAGLRSGDRTARIGAHDVLAQTALSRADQQAAWAQLDHAAALCLQADVASRECGPDAGAAALLLTAARCHAADVHPVHPCATERVRRWLQGLAQGSRVPVPLQREAGALLAIHAARAHDATRSLAPAQPPGCIDVGPAEATLQLLDTLLAPFSVPCAPATST